MVPATKKKKSKAATPGRGNEKGLESLLQLYLDEFIKTNRASQVIAAGLRVIGIGLRPVLDHLVFRTLNIEARAEEWISYGYRVDRRLSRIHADSESLRIYRKAGFPALIFAQPSGGKKGQKSPISKWVKAFGDRNAYQVGVLVDDIDQAVFYLEKQGIPFTGVVVGERDGVLRQSNAQPEVSQGMILNVVQLVERHCGDNDFPVSHIKSLTQSVKRG